MDIVVDLDDKKGKENNFVSELEPMEALGKACMLISCCLRCLDSTPWCSGHCCPPAFCTVVLEGINRWGLGWFSKLLALWRWKWLEQPLYVLWNISCPGSVCVTRRWDNQWGGVDPLCLKIWTWTAVCPWDKQKRCSWCTNKEEELCKNASECSWENEFH